MYQRYIELSEAAGLSPLALVSEEYVTVGVVPGGCFGSEELGVYRPTIDSLMNNNVPIMGSVNRRRAEQVLDLWPEPEPIVTPPPATEAPATESPATEAPTTGPTAEDSDEQEEGAAVPASAGNGSDTTLWLGFGLAAAAVALAVGTFARRRTARR